MAEAATATLNKPAWVDLATSDPAGARSSTRRCSAGTSRSIPTRNTAATVAKVAAARTPPGSAATMSPEQPSAWSIYIGSDDAEALAEGHGAGGKVSCRAVRCRRPGPDGGLPGPVAGPSSRPGSRPDGGFQHRRRECVRLGGAQRARRRHGAAVLRAGLRLDAQDERLARAAVHRVPGRRSEHRRGDRDDRRWCRPKCRTTGSSTSTRTMSTPRIGRPSKPADASSSPRWTSPAAACRSSTTHKARRSDSSPSPTDSKASGRGQALRNRDPGEHDRRVERVVDLVGSADAVRGDDVHELRDGVGIDRAVGAGRWAVHT